jgi:hypothetical protein
MYSVEASYFLGHPTYDPKNYLDALYEAGLGDCTLGVSCIGFLGITCDREGNNQLSVERSILEDIRKVFPYSNLVIKKIYVD